MKELSKQLKAIANERRLKILTLLAAGRRRKVGDLARALKLSFRSTSRHLQVLKQAGFLEDEQVKLYVYYRLRRDHPVYRCFVRLF